jgi:hypothetical protein
MKEIVFLLEEASMLETLKGLEPQLVPSDVQCRFVPHEGIKELEKSIPRKLRAWVNQSAKFVVIRDKHSADCRIVKQKLVNICKSGLRPDTLIRIVCPELESWFLGDLAAVEKAYCLKGVAKRQKKAKYRDPDRLINAAQELQRLTQQYQKSDGSRRIAPHMNLQNNKSYSFNVFVSGIRRILACEDAGSESNTVPESCNQQISDSHHV